MIYPEKKVSLRVPRTDARPSLLVKYTHQDVQTHINPAIALAEKLQKWHDEEKAYGKLTEKKIFDAHVEKALLAKVDNLGSWYKFLAGTLLKTITHFLTIDEQEQEKYKEYHFLATSAAFKGFDGSTDFLERFYPSKKITVLTTIDGYNINNDKYEFAMELATDILEDVTLANCSFPNAILQGFTINVPGFAHQNYIAFTYTRQTKTIDIILIEPNGDYDVIHRHGIKNTSEAIEISPFIKANMREDTSAGVYARQFGIIAFIINDLLPPQSQATKVMLHTFVKGTRNIIGWCVGTGLLAAFEWKRDWEENPSPANQTDVGTFNHFHLAAHIANGILNDTVLLLLKDKTQEEIEAQAWLEVQKIEGSARGKPSFARTSIASAERPPIQEKTPTLNRSPYPKRTRKRTT